MKSVLVFFLIFTWITACAEKPLESRNGTPLSVLKLFPTLSGNSIDKACNLEYRHEHLRITEQYCDDGIRNGIYITDASGIRYFNWYDESLSLWIKQEGCNEPNACFYIVELNGSGVIEKIEYHFFVNLTEGHYEIDLTGRDIRVRNKTITHHPS